MKDNEQQRFLSIQELAIYLDVSPSWVKSQVFKRTIPFLKFNRLVKFDLFEIEKWIEDRKIKEESWN